MEYVDFGERKVKGKQIETHISDSDKTTLDEIAPHWTEAYKQVLSGAMIPPYQETKSYKKGDLISWNGHLLQAKVDLTRANEGQETEASVLPKEYSPSYVDIDNENNKWEYATLRNINNSEITEDVYDAFSVVSVDGEDFYNAPIKKFGEALNTELKKKQSIYLLHGSAYPDFTDLIDSTHQTINSIDTSSRKIRLEEYLTNSLIRIANYITLDKRQLPDYPWNVGPSHKTEGFKLATIDSFLYTLVGELNSAFMYMVPNAGIYVNDKAPVGINLGLLDTQLKTVTDDLTSAKSKIQESETKITDLTTELTEATDQLNAIPATLNPSIDGTIVKKDSTVAENLMLLDTQINNLKQEVEQLKNKQ